MLEAEEEKIKKSQNRMFSFDMHGKLHLPVHSNKCVFAFNDDFPNANEMEESLEECIVPMNGINSKENILYCKKGIQKNESIKSDEINKQPDEINKQPDEINKQPDEINKQSDEINRQSDEIEINKIDNTVITNKNTISNNIYNENFVQYFTKTPLINNNHKIYNRFLNFRQALIDQNVYYCFKEYNKANNNDKTIKNKEMDCPCSSDTFNDKKMHKNGVLKKFINFDNNIETASFVRENIRIRLENDFIDKETPTKANGLINKDIKRNEIRSKTREYDGDTFSFEEIKSILNLRTISFSEMPLNPCKIGEASFSEVFMIENQIYKIIPFNQWYGIDAFCKEAFILDILREEDGVCRLNDRFLVQGKYSEEYLKAWDVFVGSDNPRPSQFEETQMFGVLVMEDCGCDLEKYIFQSFDEIINFMDQILNIICRLEKAYKFEHRDMHWGNIMIKDSKVFIIDLNFSRLESGKIVYTDLNTQEWLFEGDKSVDIQFEIYVEMKKASKSNWKQFNRKTNMLWMRYLIRKLELKFKQSSYCDIKNKKMMGKIINKSYEFPDCEGFKQWFDKIK